MRLGEECREAMGDAEPLGCLLGVSRAACAPAIKLCASLVKVPDMTNDAGNGNDRGSGGANERVIDIDINGERHG